MKIKYLLLIIALLAGCSSGDEALAIYQSGVKEFNARNLAGAEKYFLEAIEKDSGLLNAHLMLCKIYYYNKNYSTAITSADAILDQDPDHANALYWKARSLVMSAADNNGEPVNLLLRSLEIDGHNIQARLLLGMIYEKNSQYREALNQYLAVVDDEEYIVSARGSLAMLYIRMGLGEKAERELDAAEKIAEASGMGVNRIRFIKEEAGKMK